MPDKLSDALPVQVGFEEHPAVMHKPVHVLRKTTHVLIIDAHRREMTVVDQP
jgi:hypothetical protein